MTDEQKAALDKALWAAANDLRGKIHADDFRDYILGFIFYKYLSDKIINFANKEVGNEDIDFTTLDENDLENNDLLKGLKDEAIDQLGYFLKPSQLFDYVTKNASTKPKDDDEEDDEKFILTILANIFDEIEKSTQGEASADEFCTFI